MAQITPVMYLYLEKCQAFFVGLPAKLRGAAKGAPTEGKQDGVQWDRWQQVALADLLDGMSPMEFILRFTFTHPDLHTNIVGTINPAHLQHNVDVLRQGPLPADVYAEAKRRLQAAGSIPRGG